MDGLDGSESEYGFDGTRNAMLSRGTKRGGAATRGSWEPRCLKSGRVGRGRGAAAARLKR